MKNKTLWLEQNCAGSSQPQLLSAIILLSSRVKAWVCLWDFQIFPQNEWLESKQQISWILTWEFSKLILKGKDISHSISSHVKRQFCFLNAFAKRFTWDLQIHMRSWFAHHCRMQGLLVSTQLSVGNEAWCQLAIPPPSHSLEFFGQFLEKSSENKQTGFEALD